METQDYYVLLVDDDAALLETMKTILEGKGYNVDTATTGEVALERIRQRHYDVVVLDIVLPDISGIELLKSLGTNRIPKVRKIILTGHATLTNAIQALNTGADAYLLKPVAPDELMRTIAEQIGKQKQEILLVQDKIRHFIEMDAEERIRRIAEEKYL